MISPFPATQAILRLALEKALTYGRLPPSHFFRPVKHFYFGGFTLRSALQFMLVRCSHKSPEQRMRFQGLRFELWMKLATNEMRMVGKFDDFHVSAVGSRAGNP